MFARVVKGAPLLRGSNEITYEVHKRNRKTFALSFGHPSFEGWAEDGQVVSGSISFPRFAPLKFEKAFTSGRELIFNEYLELHNACDIGEKVALWFDQPILRSHGIDGEKDDPKISDEEGAASWRAHKTFERNARIAREIRDDAQGTCGLCKRHLKDLYGEIGDTIIEAHHLELISKLTEPRVPKKSDFMALCPNCHRWTHALMRRERLTKLSAKELRRHHANTLNRSSGDQ